jgi:hypothetical protein
MVRKWALLAKSFQDVTGFAAGHRCETLEENNTSAHSTPSQQQNGPRRRRKTVTDQALIWTRTQQCQNMKLDD